MKPAPIANVRNAAPSNTHRRAEDNVSLADKTESNLQRTAAGTHAASGDRGLDRSLGGLAPRRDQQTGSAHFDALLNFIEQVDIFSGRHRGQQRGQSGAD